MGFSMSASAFILTRHPDVKAIVADSPYASLEGVVAQQFFFLPGPTKWPLVALTKLYARLLLGAKVSDAVPADAVADLKIPLLLIHGDADSQIPVEHSRQIQAKANPTTTEFWIVPGADHGIANVGYLAIDSLRLEKGYLYWSAELSPDVSPYEAGLGFCVALHKGDFLGRAALAEIKAVGPERRICTFSLEGFAPLSGGEASKGAGSSLREGRSVTPRPRCVPGPLPWFSSGRLAWIYCPVYTRKRSLE
jgi:hypothetical protein